MTPTLCVLIPVFNGTEGLARTLRSLSEAGPADFDIIVVDDGSETAIQLAPGAAGSHRVTCSRLAVNGGITRALNHGLQLAYSGRYRYIARVDAGDTVRPDRFELQLKHLESHPGCGIVGSLIDFVDMKGETLFIYKAPPLHQQIARRMQVENCIIHSGVMLRTGVVRRVGGYRPKCRTSEDYDLFLRMLQISEAVIIPEALTRCEYNLAGLSIARRGRQQRERLKLQLEHFQPASWMSYYGVARTCVAMFTPHPLVLAAKRLAQNLGGARLENPVAG